MPTAGEIPQTPTRQTSSRLSDVLKEGVNNLARQIGNHEDRTGVPLVGSYTKKPVTIEAMRLSDLNAPIILLWMSRHGAEASSINDPSKMQTSIDIPTLEGTMRADVGDWIIKGVKGEFYPIKNDIFESTYGPAERPAPKLTEAEIADITANKSLRKALDEQIQILKKLPGSAERSTALRKLREAVMWLGMDLKRLSDDRPYPSSYDPTSTKIEPTADGLKL